MNFSATQRDRETERKRERETERERERERETDRDTDRDKDRDRDREGESCVLRVEGGSSPCAAVKPAFGIGRVDERRLQDFVFLAILSRECLQHLQNNVSKVKGSCRLMQG